MHTSGITILELLLSFVLQKLSETVTREGEMMEEGNELRQMPRCGVRRYGRLNSDFVLPQHLHDHIRRFLTCGVWRNHQLQNARLARSRCARAPC